MLPACTAQFLCLRCESDDIFRPEYERSNRAKGTKIMRCFPHCCPEHIDRSYCGTSLSVLVTLDIPPHQQRAMSERHVSVLARFETRKYPQRLEVGTRLSPAEIDTVRDWIVGVERSNHHTSASRSERVFALNDQVNAKWYYEWESGANKSKRLMKHVLTVYVFMTASDNSAMLLERIMSTPFSLTAFRRNARPASVGLQHHQLPRHGSHDSSHLDALVDHRLSQAIKCQDTRDASPVALRTACTPVHARDTLGTWVLANESVLVKIKSLAVLWFAMSRIPAMWLMSACHPTSWLVQCCGVFHPEATVGRRHDQLFASVAALSAWFWSNDNIQRFHQFFCRHSADVLDVQGTRGAYLKLGESWFHHINQFLVAQPLDVGAKDPVTSLDDIVNAIIARVFQDNELSSWRSEIREILTSSRPFLFSTFVAQLRENLTTRNRPQRELRSAQLPDVPVLNLAGGWRVVPEEFKLQLQDGSFITPSLLSFVQLVSLLEHLDVQFLAPSTFKVRSSSSIASSVEHMLLTCDGIPRTTRVYPNGVSTLAHSAWLAGDYVGQTVEPHHVRVTMCWWRKDGKTAEANNRDSAWRVTIALRRDPGVPHALRYKALLSVHNRPLTCECPLELLSAKQRMGLVEMWTPVVSITGAYLRAQSCGIQFD